MYLRIKQEPRRYEYTDLAITPVTEDEVATHEMFHNATARAYIDQEQRLEKVRHGEAA